MKIDSLLFLESITVECEKCSPCWNLFSKNYGPCSTEEYHFNPFNTVQPVCIDTLILLIIMFLSILILIPTCLWLLYIWMKHCRNIDGKYVVNGRLIA
jgi:hypothetical protein